MSSVPPLRPTQHPARAGAALAAMLAVWGGATLAQEAPRWDWQLQPPFELSADVAIIDLDPDEVDAADVQALQARGVMTVAYISVGTWEEWRSDAGAFPDHVLGRVYGDWPDERFLDIRDHATLLPIMRERFARAAAMGFDAIEPDNLDVHINESGFAVGPADLVAYAEALAEMAHGMGLQIGQKNVPDLVPQLVPVMDFMVAEGCFDDGWCDAALPYLAAGKPVLDAEYTDTSVDFTAACAYAAAEGLSMILHDRDLAGPAHAACP
ncbi:endo alpha-1,4 polygalactosaminidase [Pseudoroseicyclus tamaricis]|uniref:Endo alpha-1,4 polygalactosaminidase n=1 Tax=Pseudoroseicyclus tamaricis TaxID=2705421 RepID=A0A6B2JU71_9RHOB|nr:endo alpha-1,4 polygalactosaminidase [Pseudoroseicyclus tamaricis]NDU99723.1 endo alpha-1,4 polygalactosaminidase [Pseudoroseicyclus tamaricis]